MKNLLSLFKNPLFILGLVFRLILIASILPSPVGSWYVPFLENSINPFGIDPWQSWIRHNGTPIAFPYGYAMWLFLLPATFICKLLSLPLAYGYGLSLMAADFGLLVILRKLLNCKDWLLLAIYWLSPISLIASYWLGFNDIIPVFSLMSAVYFLKRHHLLLSGTFLMAAISAKFSMILSFPFFLIYLFNNRNLRQIFRKYIAGLSIGFFIFFAPFLGSQAGLSMLSSNPEIDKVYQFSIGLDHGTSLYLVPLGYMLMLYVAWRIRRMNFEIFNAILGMVFLLVVLLTPISLGWFIWILPLLISYQASSDRVAIYITSFFSGLYAFSAVLYVSAQKMNLIMQVLGLSTLIGDSQFIGLRLASLTHTALVGTGMILAVRIWRETVIRNDFFRLSRKPFVVGIAGDSGAGKDTVSDAILGLFGHHSVTAISGDDYHLWDRQQPMWRVMTHINPSANDLEGFAKDLIALTDGRSIKKSHYDHDTGKMSIPVNVSSNDVIIASGLHALYLPILRECYDLKIYLDIDEDLRKYFKINRDVNLRGYTVERVLESLEKRRPDSNKFIKPQEAFADLIFSIQPINSAVIEKNNDSQPPSLKLVVKSRHGFNEITLKRILIGICGLHVDMSINNSVTEVELTIEGETSDLDIQMAAELICPKIFEFLDLRPKWQNGVLGLMQLVTLSHINQVLTRRFI
ncbi:uridine kinase [Polynucleobacter paneuropaeus]|nr:uridine kinase [Polynucleobacter paneuropaeus]